MRGLCFPLAAVVTGVVLAWMAPAEGTDVWNPGSLEFSGEVRSLCDRAVRGESQWFGLEGTHEGHLIQSPAMSRNIFH